LFVLGFALRALHVDRLLGDGMDRQLGEEGQVRSLADDGGCCARLRQVTWLGIARHHAYITNFLRGRHRRAVRRGYRRHRPGR
jgi:hypothetical protein